LTIKSDDGNIVVEKKPKSQFIKSFWSCGENSSNRLNWEAFNIFIVCIYIELLKKQNNKDRPKIPVR